MQHLCFGRNNKAIKTSNKISIMTIMIKGHGICKISSFLKFHKSRMNILEIANLIKKNLTLRFAHKKMKNKIRLRLEKNITE